jgi:hypothetical protein
LKKRAKKNKGKAPSPKKHRRKLGAYKDTIKIADDFDAPLSGALLRAFEETDTETATRKK